MGKNGWRQFTGAVQGTNPEELIAAAPAGCFTMALAFELQMVGFKPELVTEAPVTLEPGGALTVNTLNVNRGSQAYPS